MSYDEGTPSQVNEPTKLEKEKPIGRCAGTCAYAQNEKDSDLIKCRVCGRIKAIRQAVQTEAGWHVLF